MCGVIIDENNYVYEGKILDGEPHGVGIFYFSNGDTYRGKCQFSRLDGFGVYTYKNGSIYTGFFSYGKFHGVGTYEDNEYIYKGQWRNDKKHGMFFKTAKLSFETYTQRWNKGKLILTEKTQYIPPKMLQTSEKNNTRKNNTRKSNTHIRDGNTDIKTKKFRGIEKKCIGCCEDSTNSTNANCGHVVMCYNCLKKCDTCPICRSPITNIIKLFIC